MKSPQLSRFTSTCAIVAILAAIASAQKPTIEHADGPADPARASSHASSTKLGREERATLEERNRETMHPGDPLKLVGVEQGDNDIRSRTPILKQMTTTGGAVDPQELYERTLALYTDRARFQKPLTSQVAMLAPIPRTSRHADPSRSDAEPTSRDDSVPSESSWPWFVVGGALFGLAFWWLRRDTPTKPNRPGTLRAT